VPHSCSDDTCHAHSHGERSVACHAAAVLATTTYSRKGV
jgi:hypothetical protein